MRPGARDVELPQTLAGRYRLDAVLGEGGMGVVYRGFDLTIQRPVAVKLLHGGISEVEAKRLLAEVRAAAMVKSAHCATIFDVVETPDGAPFLVMELVEGETLEAVLEREGPLPVARAVAIAIQVSDALGAAHAAGVVHRDVKPANVMLSRAADGDHATVLDFGVARRIDQASAVTGAGLVAGTLAYMAPEQISGDHTIDGRADQYALAATLVRMVSGQRLYDAEDVASLIHDQLLVPPVRLGQRVEDVPALLDAAIARALEKKPAARHPDIGAFARALAASIGASAPNIATAGGVPSPATKRASPGLPREIELDADAGDVKLELASGPPPPTPAAPRPAAAAMPHRPSRAAERHVDERTVAILSWLHPELWKRVCGYSALAFLIGRYFFRLSAVPQVVLGLGVVLGAGALVLRAWLYRRL